MIGNPFPLKANAKKSFQGSIVLGKGFVLEPDEAEALIAKDPRNKEVLFPYLNGDDLNNDPEQKPSRWVINFFDWSEEKARTYPDCFEILEERVKPERQRWKTDEDGNEIIGTYALRKPLPQKWWIYGEKRPALYKTISQLDQVMVVAQVSKTLAFAFVPKDQVISMMCVVLALNDYLSFCLLQSTIHKKWVQKYASALKADTRYTPSDVFETFPFPPPLMNEQKEALILAGKAYDEFRKTIMRDFKLGLTKMYNQFHNKSLKQINNDKDISEDRFFEKEYGKDSLWLKKHLQSLKSPIYYNQFVERIEELRVLHIRLDLSVLDAYGWNDISLKHGFYDIDYLPENDRMRFSIHPNARKEILKRLLALNHRLHALEIEPSKSIISKKDLKEENSSPTLF